MEKEKKVWTYRWLANETAVSCVNRTYGEYVSATKLQNMIKEMMIKGSLYNLFRRMV
jgi:hypothetical protein